MRILIIVAFTGILLGTASCNLFGERLSGNGNVTSETRRISNTTKIKATSSIDIVLEKGPAAVRIEADENLLPYIITEVEDGWLSVKFEDNMNVNTNNDIKAYVTLPGITAIRLSGSGNVKADNKFSSDEEIKLSLSGSGNITLPLNLPAISASMSGSGDINISGETKNVTIKIAGSGNFNGKSLKAEHVKIAIAGSGNVSIFSSLSLNASIAGSGDVRYAGNAEVKQSIAGSGSVKQMQ